MQNIIQEIQNERQSQDNQWGGPNHDDTHSGEDWLRFIDHQGAKARLSEEGGQIRHRLIKIAALAIAGIESLDRKAE